MRTRVFLLALGLALAFTGLVQPEPSVAGCAPNFHWTDFGPVWSPTGDKIAYQRIEIGCFGPRSVYVVGADGGTSIRMPFGGQRPSWSPDGRRLAFSYNLVVANADGSGYEELRRYPSWDPTWSPDGRHIAFGSGSGYLDIYRIGSDGFGEVNLTNTPGVGEGSSSWSPRGDLIAFTFGQTSSVAVMSPDGNGRRTVYTGGPPQTQLVWSPDGTRLAFLRRLGVYTLELVVLDVATGANRVVAHGAIAHADPSWSPDSNRISFTRTRPWPEESTIRTVRADGSDERELGRGGDLAWSPDGSRIAFVAYGDHCPSRRGLYVAAPDRSTETRITNECRIVGTDEDDLLRGSMDDDIVRALAGNDRIESLYGSDRVDAGEGNDIVHGDQAPDLITGGPGNDRLYGEMGADTLVGGPGRDRLVGGHGIDRIMARDGAVDRIICGSHRDVVLADRRDRVARDCERVRRA
jgi:Tol biopolymer transport system component